MKTLSSLFFSVFLLFFSLDSTEEKQTSIKVQEIFSGENIVILSKDEPLSFLSAFEKGDKIKMTCKIIQQLNQSANINDLSFKLIKMPDQLVEELDYKQLKKTFAIPTDGNYKLAIDFPDKKGLFKLPKPILSLKIGITIVCDTERYERLKWEKRTLTVRDLKMGIQDHKKAKDKYPVIKLDLRKGDEVTFKSIGNEKAIMKYEELVKSEIFALADQSGPFIAPKNRVYSFKFYLENIKGDLKKMLKRRRYNDNVVDRIFKNLYNQGIIPCDDLVIRYTPLPKPKSRGGGKPKATPKEENKTPAITFDNSAAVAEAQKSRELMREDMKDRREFNKIMLEMREEEAKRLEAIENKRRKRMIRDIDTLTRILPAKMNLSGKQRWCRELDGAVDDKTHSLIYWLAVGRNKNIKEAFEQKEAKRLSVNKSYDSLMQYFEKKRTGLNVRIPPVDREYIEFAIVNSANKELFTKGADYTAFNDIKNPHTYHYYGRDTTISFATDDLYACFCNHNKNIPVVVNFRYETFGDYE